MTALEPPRRVCAVCARVLAATTRDGEFVYRHERIDSPADHPAVPVAPQAIQTRARCDFCLAEDPAWIVPARSFQPAGTAQMSVGAWAACQVCAPLIGRNQWAALRRHVIARYRDADRLGGLSEQVVAAGLSRLWRQLRPHITGEPVRIHATDGYPPPADGGHDRHGNSRPAPGDAAAD